MTDTELEYRLLLKPTGGFWLLFSDRTLIDIDMTTGEMCALARQMLDHAAYVDQVPRDVLRPSATPGQPKCL